MSNSSILIEADGRNFVKISFIAVCKKCSNRSEDIQYYHLKDQYYEQEIPKQQISACSKCSDLIFASPDNAAMEFIESIYQPRQKNVSYQGNVRYEKAENFRRLDHAKLTNHPWYQARQILRIETLVKDLQPSSKNLTETIQAIAGMYKGRSDSAVAPLLNVLPKLPEHSINACIDIISSSSTIEQIDQAMIHILEKFASNESIIKHALGTFLPEIIDNKGGLRPLLTHTRSPFPAIVRMTAVTLTRKIFAQNASGEDVTLIRDTFSKALSDPDPDVRSAALENLKEIPQYATPEILKTIETIKKKEKRLRSLAAETYEILKPYVKKGGAAVPSITGEKKRGLLRPLLISLLGIVVLVVIAGIVYYQFILPRQQTPPPAPSSAPQEKPAPQAEEPPSAVGTKEMTAETDPPPVSETTEPETSAENQPTAPSVTAEEFLAAAQSGDITTIKNAVQSGLDLNTRDQNGSTALMWAAYHGQIEIMTMLIATGAELNAKSNLGNTAMIAATLKHQTAAVKLLIEVGADVNQKNEKGQTALQIAETNGYDDVADLLKNAGAE